MYSKDFKRTRSPSRLSPNGGLVVVVVRRVGYIKLGNFANTATQITNYKDMLRNARTLADSSSKKN
jgi:hypothetical protein